MSLFRLHAALMFKSFSNVIRSLFSDIADAPNSASSIPILDTFQLEY